MVYVALLLGLMFVSSILVVASCMLSSQISHEHSPPSEKPLRSTAPVSYNAKIPQMSSGAMLRQK